MEKIEIENLIGQYYILHESTKQQSREYKLQIIKESEDKITFRFEVFITGYHGGIGTIWLGICDFKKGAIFFEANQKQNWSISEDGKIQKEDASRSKESFISEITREGENIILRFHLETRALSLCKIEPKIENVSIGVVKGILKHYKLDIKVDEAEPGRFWRVSNLILKDSKKIDFEGTDAYETLCDYDLDLVIEEKRVVKDDEIIREHHIDKVIFNKVFKILEYKVIK
jgi:hypothetical protein